MLAAAESPAAPTPDSASTTATAPVERQPSSLVAQAHALAQECLQLGGGLWHLGRHIGQWREQAPKLVHLVGCDNRLRQHHLEL